jgi:menaquinone-specific isochorismate synthase
MAEICDLHPQIWWSDTAAGTTWLGLGSVDDQLGGNGIESLALPDTCRERLALIQGPAGEIRHLRYFGGIPFDPSDLPHPMWREGGSGRFVLPAILFRHQRGQDLVRAFHLGSDDGELTLRETWARGLLDGTGPSSLAARPKAPVIEDAAHPWRLDLERSGAEAESWNESVERALRRIEAGGVRKIVLSRELRYVNADGDLKPWRVVRSLQAAGPRGIVFCFRFHADAAFLGATPERLAHVQDRNIRCDCLAGTAARGGDPIEDAQRAVDLLASEKDLREHRFVRDGILDALRPHTVWLETTARPEVLYLARLLHLESPVRGFLKAGVSFGDVLKSLHPTPAVGGSPRDLAVPLIRGLEGRPRGWYAGPIGWVSSSSMDLAVGIRSAVVRGPALIVTGGAGIVAGSDPAAEWEETARKAASLVSPILGEGAQR